jgi:sodium transport system permease protein
LWLRHIIRDRGATPSVAEAMLCGLLILLMTFFASLRMVPPKVYGDFVRMVTVTQVGLIAAPVAIMTVCLARSPRHTLLLAMPRVWTLPGALLLAVALHPLVVLLAQGIEATYPISEDTLRTLDKLSSTMQAAELWQILLVVAVLPAICEELAFRGFILSGLRHLGSPGAAVAISSVLFGLTHGMLQQSLSAIAVGFVMGYLALQTRSLLPCAIFHFTHNSMSVIASRQVPQLLDQPSWLAWLMHPTGSQVVPFGYNWPIIALGAVASLAILLAFRNASRD